MNEPTYIDVFCIIYYICSYVQTIPQIIRLVRRKSSADYSLLQILIQFIGVSCWTVFIFLGLNDLIVYIGTAIDWILMVLIHILILKYHKQRGEKNGKME